jgi:hypothetical protein
MRREDLQELHYIAPISNLSSIMSRGILSHNRVEKIEHVSVAKPEVQEMRMGKQIPNGGDLHDYVNLYIHARNPMLYKRSMEGHQNLCVLRINTTVLDLPNVVVSSQNAASKYALFAPVSNGLELIDFGMVFAEDWRHPNDQIASWQHRSIKCAEVLVPNRIDSSYIFGIYVSCEEAERTCKTFCPSVPITVDPHFFFLT